MAERGERIEGLTDRSTLGLVEGTVHGGMKQRRSAAGARATWAGWGEADRKRTDGQGRAVHERGTWGTWACQGTGIGCMTDEARGEDPHGWGNTLMGASPSLTVGGTCAPLHAPPLSLFSGFLGILGVFSGPYNKFCW